MVRLLATIIVGIGASLLLITAPVRGDFWWSDASRHAMDGAFFYEFFSHFPILDIRGWAVDFYLRRPALTVGFYPPLFGLVESILYGLLGTTHFAAQCTVALFAFGLGMGTFELARRWLSPLSALAASLLILGFPEMAFWGRQVMLEIPVYAFLVWSAHWFLEYLSRERIAHLIGAVLLYAAALYTKLTVVFLFPVFVFFLLFHFGPGHFRRPGVAGTAVGFALFMAPLIWMTLEFGGVNVGAVAGGQTANEFHRMSVENWLYYLRKLPEMVGPLGMVPIAGAFLAGTLARRNGKKAINVSLSFLAAWFFFGYLFFSLVALKEPRHGVFLLLPLLLLSLVAWERAPFPWPAGPGLLGIASLVFLGSLFFRPVPFVSGHASAADFVAEHTPPGYRVMIHSYWDGNFIFRLWSRGDREKLPVLRSDKILLRMAVKRSMGVEQKRYSKEELRRIMNDNGIYYIVCEAGFWDDIGTMKRFEEFLRTDEQFHAVADFPISSNVLEDEKRLVVYRNRRATPPATNSFQMELPIIDRQFSGDLP
jgi:hypothetical protein